jgi:hypothetical protein
LNVSAFGFGTYNVTLDAGNLPATSQQIAYSMDSFETSSVPGLTAAAFTGLIDGTHRLRSNVAYNPGFCGQSRC